MNFLDLTGAKSRPGSIHNWVNYKKTPVEVVLDEAQALIYSRLRVREMRASTVITLAEHAFTTALPSQFLEPISMVDRQGWNVIPECFVEERGLQARRIFDNEVVTTLGSSLTAGATTLTVASASAFPVSGNFSIQIDSEALLVTAGHSTTTWTVTRGFGGTTAAAHSSGTKVDGSLQSATPMNVAIFDELFQFDCKSDEARTFDLAYYRTPDLLSASNTTNWLTRRYPQFVRKACQATAADFMKDAEEYARLQSELYAWLDAANAESDLSRAA